MCDADNTPNGYAFVQADTLLTQGRGTLRHVQVSAGAAGYHCTLYDGNSANGRVIAKFDDPGLLGIGMEFAPADGVPYEFGLFIAVANGNVTVVWRTAAD
ncbi:MAG: hypothetical protein IVW53_15450 [Chloroflexi bacterium]|nr:hypothetical protein [Chloroflexota bacterium]